MSNVAADMRFLIDGFQQLREHELNTVFNPERPEMLPTPTQQAILSEQDILIQYVVGGNRAGKSQLGSRILSWWFNNTHPYIKRPESWGSSPLTLMLIGRVGSQIEYELFDKKLKPYLMPGTYSEDWKGGSLQAITHKTNGNRILFFSHHNITEAREKVQAFDVQFIWLDEMADDASFIAELQMRLLTKRGRMICTFTPLVRSEEVRRMVDGAQAPISCKYIIRMLDNPMFADPKRQVEILESMKDMSEAERRTRLYGDWYIGDTAVYHFDGQKHVAYAATYSPAWRHVLAVDPASTSKTGYTLWAEEPETGTWYCIASKYFVIFDPNELIAKIEATVSRLNIVRRISDTAPWFVQAAATKGYAYTCIHKKAYRKHELIKNLQAALSAGKIKIGPNCTELIDEFLTCQWADEASQKIVGSSRFHHLDSAQYFVDNMPKHVPVQTYHTLQGMEAMLRQNHKAQQSAKIKAEQARKKLTGSKMRRRW